MTFSIVARCAKTGQFGMAVASSSPAVAARCAYARAGIGAAASQNVTDPRLGPAALDRLAAGLDAEAALDAVIGAAEHVEYRQLLIVDRDGNTAIHSGGKSLGIHTEHAARDVAAAGNLLANDTIPRAMVEAFLSSEGHLGERLITAMRGALAAGGEAGPVHSAGCCLSVDRTGRSPNCAATGARTARSRASPPHGMSTGHRWMIMSPARWTPQPRQAMAFRATNSAGPLPSRPVTARPPDAHSAPLAWRHRMRAAQG